MYRTQIQLLARAAHWPVERYGDEHFSITPAIIRELRELSYFEQWRKARANSWFHVELEDHSLVLFSESTNAASFSYLQCPLSVPSFREFLNTLNLQYSTQNRRELRDEYELVLDTADLRAHLTPIRFDYDEVGYYSGAHPASHIHIGLENQVRLGVNRRLTPISFVLFVMRQMYPDCWKRLLQHHESRRLPKEIRRDCPAVPAHYWQQNDAIELYLT